MTALALILVCGGLAWMVAVLAALVMVDGIPTPTWPPIPLRVGGRRTSTWQNVWRDPA